MSFSKNSRFDQQGRPLDRVSGGGRHNHQAGRRQDAVNMTPFHRLVDGNVQAKVIGGDDQSFHAAPFDLAITVPSAAMWNV